MSDYEALFILLTLIQILLALIPLLDEDGEVWQRNLDKRIWEEYGNEISINVCGPS